MRCFDVCNGDADGLCAVLQWRLERPAPATLVTGLKRDIALLERVPAGPGDEVLVCDLSMQRNRAALTRLLAAGARVRYFDHHAAGEIPQHPGLEVHLDAGSGVCTCVLMDRHLQGRRRAWAAVGAFGDNLQEVGHRLAVEAGLSDAQCEQLQELGRSINYNAYGESESDVHVAPAVLYGILSRHENPLEAVRSEPVLRELRELRAADLNRARASSPLLEGDRASVHLLPDAAWSRRVVGTFANDLATAYPDRAHAVLVETASGGGWRVSVRAPLSSPSGADELCRRFGGSGRTGAAGIDLLPRSRLADFLDAFLSQRWGQHHPGFDISHACGGGAGPS